MILIFIGPPFSGKGTQAELLGEKLRLPVLSMGNLIREAYKAGDKDAIEGFERYSLKGLHLPIVLKFKFLKKELDNLRENFILDNFPATQEDLDAFNDYILINNLKVDKVLFINISEKEMMSRLKIRGRKDDNPQVVIKRRKIQDSDREAVITFYKKQNILIEINGEKDIETVQNEIQRHLNI